MRLRNLIANSVFYFSYTITRFGGIFILIGAWLHKKFKTPKGVQITEFEEQVKELEKLILDGKAKFDIQGRLRYLHGAPVGDLILTKKKDGTPIYKESPEEWFDPESPKAEEFVWPD